MSPQEAIRILMLSPVYFKLAPIDRKKLITEYCALFDEVSGKSEPVTAKDKS
jgi:hypothetical protein